MLLLSAYYILQWKKLSSLKDKTLHCWTIVADMQDGIWLLTQDENGLLAHSSFHAGDDAEACSLGRGFGPIRWRPQGNGNQDEEVVKQQAKNGCPQLAEGGSGWGELKTPKQEKGSWNHCMHWSPSTPKHWSSTSNSHPVVQHWEHGPKIQKRSFFFSNQISLARLWIVELLLMNSTCVATHNWLSQSAF